MEAENVTDYAQTLREEMSTKIRIEVLHGKMKPAQKNEIMERFVSGAIDVLVSTTVIEVGINVPNATVMMVEMQNGLVWRSYISFVDVSEEVRRSLIVFL